ncbi:MAG: methyltransferase, partial [Candidatus Hodarchaeota archaeon]
MKIKRRYAKSVAKGLYILIISTLLSILVVYLIRITGIEVISSILFPVDIGIPFPYNLCGLLLIVLGLMLNIWGNFTLLRKISLTEREPFHTPSALVVGGPYRFSRNPVYLSVLFLCLGAAIL